MARTAKPFFPSIVRSASKHFAAAAIKQAVGFERQGMRL
jgi:hypothetical protein